MKNHTHISWKLQPLAVAVLCVCSQQALADTPFVTQPPHLIDIKTSGSPPGVKPNVMLLVDDSGSMNALVSWESCRRGEPGCQNFGSWYNPWWIKNPKTRLTVVKEALNKVLDGYDPTNPNPDSKRDSNGDIREMNWNMMSLWTYESPVSTSGYLTAQQLRPYIGNMTPSYDTPTTIRYTKAAYYAQQAIKYQCQKNFIVMLSDGDANSGGPLSTYGKRSYHDPQNIYGGLPWNYRPYEGWPGHGVSYFSQKLKNLDLRTSGTDDEGSPWDGKQNIQTYTVGFGSGLSNNGLAYLQNAGAADDPSEQTYFKADSAQELVDAFDKIFSSIDKSAQPAGQATSSVATPANASSKIDGLAATLTLNTGIWGSEFRFNKVDDAGNPIKDSSGKQEYTVADYSGRKVLVNNGFKNYWLKGTALSAAKDDFDFPDDNEFKKGFVAWISRDPSRSDAEIEADVDALGLGSRTVDTYRERAATADDPVRQMGDVLDASIIAMGDNAKYVMTGANDGMVYILQSTGNKAVPYQLKLNYLPGGMQRESADDRDTLAKNLKKIAMANYGTPPSKTDPGNPHIYGVNGGINYVTTPKTDGRHVRTLALGAMGQGGRGVYALNIAGCERNKSTTSCNPVGLDASDSTWDKKVPLWESEKGSGNMLGYTVGKPSMYPIAKNWNANKAVYTDDVILAGFVANGHPAKASGVPYDSKPTLYIYNALGEDLGTNVSSLSNGTAGQLVKKLSADSADGAHALASPLVVDVNFDGVADLVYAGDFFGDLYRFDLRGKESDWKVSKIFDGSDKQPITAAPAVYRVSADKLIIMFGTGSDLYERDRKDTEKQAFYAVFDDLTDASPAALKTSDMEKRSLTSNGDRRIGDVGDLPTGKKGWWVELDAGSGFVGNSDNGKTSERVVTQPQVLLSTVYFTTRIYKTEKDTTTGSTKKQTCLASTESEKSSGTSWLMALNVKTGGQPDASSSAFKEVEFETNPDGTFKVDVNGNYIPKKDSFGNVITKASSDVGINLGKLSSGVNIVGGNRTGEPSALGMNGGAGNGALTLTGKPNEQDNTCVDDDNYSANVAVADASDPLVAKGLTVNLCGGGRLIRVNTREIK